MFPETLSKVHCEVLGSTDRRNSLVSDAAKLVGHWAGPSCLASVHSAGKTQKIPHKSNRPSRITKATLFLAILTHSLSIVISDLLLKAYSSDSQTLLFNLLPLQFPILEARCRQSTPQ